MFVGINKQINGINNDIIKNINATVPIAAHITNAPTQYTIIITNNEIINNIVLIIKRFLPNIFILKNFQKIVNSVKPTFNLPNFQGRYLKQRTSGTYGSESLPNITGSLGGDATTGNYTSGAFYKQTTPIVSPTYGGTVSSSDYGRAGFDASRSSSVYKNNAKVNPDNAEILYCIKY